MKKLFISILFINLFAAIHAQTKGNGMNVILFLADDLGYHDLGYTGSSFYETPRIDSFSKQAEQFTNAYAACHVCSPSRASILTGKYPARLHLTDWLPGRPDNNNQQLKSAVINQQLPFSEVTLAEMLKSYGYRTAIFGKWHLGEDSAGPRSQGFETRVPDWDKGWPNGTYFSPYNMKGLEGGKDGEYLTDRLTDEALKYIDANKDHPFFIYLSHFAVHDPIQGRPDLVEKYKRKLAAGSSTGATAYVLEPNPDTSFQFTQEQLASMLNDKGYAGFKYLPNRIVKIKQVQDNPEFAAMVESMDESFGRVVDELKKLQLDQKTIIIFFSDNGGMSAANFYKADRVIDPAKLNQAYSTSNLPYRGGKGWLYEGGIREPLLISWPGTTHAQMQTNIPVTSTDLYPTILDMLQLPLHPEQHKDGVSLAPLMNGKGKLADRAIYWHYPHYSNHGLQSPGAAIRYHQYKLIEYFEHHTVQLFDLEKDPGEQHDLSKQMPGQVKSLLAMLHQWQKNVGAQMMETNPDYHKN